MKLIIHLILQLPSVATVLKVAVQELVLAEMEKMFITGIEDNKIHEWTLSTAFDPTSKSYVDSVLLDWNNNDDSGDENYSNDQGDWVRGHAWKSDGTKLL